MNPRRPPPTVDGLHLSFRPLASSDRKILYCRCAFAKVVPDATKDAVLEALVDSGASFECVPDLCEMSARKDPRLASLLEGGGEARIAACYPRAVKWLFHSGGAPFPDDSSIEVLNMRDSSASEIVSSLLEE